MEITLAAQKLFNLGPIAITNTMLTTWMVTLILITFGYLATKKIALVPHGFQNIAELAMETFQEFTLSIAGQKTKIFLPIIASFFFFILFGNYFGLLPGVGSIGFFENPPAGPGQKIFVPFLRSMNSDLNTTVALALVSLITTHILAIKYLGLLDYVGKFLSLNPIFLFVGILEIIGEVTKILSLSFRLFGNIYAGEVLLTTASTRLFAFILPVPFYFLELLIGFVQALIFAMLTLVFMVILTEKSGH